MSSKNAIGVAPLVLGGVQLWNALPGLLFGPSVTPAPAYGLLAQLIGGVAAMVVGVGILLGWGSFAVDDERDTDSTVLVLVAVAALGFSLGALSIVLG